MNVLVGVFIYSLALVGCGGYLLYDAMRQARLYEGISKYAFYLIGVIGIVLLTLGILTMSFVAINLPR